MTPAESIPGIVGRRLRELRDASGHSQDELAAAARRAGLDWTRGSVASLETGRRGLSAEELMRLPAALHFLDGRSHTIDELVEDVNRITRSVSAPAEAGAGETREAERHVARVLGVAPDRVAEVAYRRWSRGLTEEREARVADRAGDQAPSPRSLQASRGHVTRQLIDELRQAIEGEDDDG